MYFLIKIILFYTKNLFIRPKNCVQIIFYNEKCKKFCKNQFFSNIFTFLSVIRQNFEETLRILANFTLKIYLFVPKIAFKSFFTTKNAKSFAKINFLGKNQFFSNIFTFLSVIRQNFEETLRILANFGKFSCKNSKIYGVRPYIFKKLQGFFLYFLIKIILFTLKIYSYGPKIAFKAFCTTKDAKSFVKTHFLETFLHF